MKSIKIGNAGGFWGDSPTAARLLLEQQPDLDFLTMDYLAEVSLSIMAAQREKNPSAGYARDFVEVIRSLHPLNTGCKIITNAGGLHPQACAEAVKEVVGDSKKIGVVTGDDLLHLFPGQQTANAYLGAEGIVEALQKGADIVITGRVADPSLTVAPCLYSFGWRPDAYDQIAGATVAGHIIECGRQATGGIATDWVSLPDPVAIPFPIAEVYDDGSFAITKPPHTGGRVSLRTVKEQLLYEIEDPDAYLSPDATVSFLKLRLEQERKDRVVVNGAKGRAPPDTYKVSASSFAGYKAESILALFGDEPYQNASFAAAALFSRLEMEGITFARRKTEIIGMGQVTYAPMPPDWYPNGKECALRMAVFDPDRDAVDRFSREVASLVTSGPQGITGYATGRAPVRAVYGYRAESIPKEKVAVEVTIL